jgi:hydroxypyruvate reductase
MTTDRFHTKTLDSHPRGEQVKRILEAALAAVEPGGAIRRFIQRDGNELVVQGARYSLQEYRRVRIVGTGKAGAPMAAAAEEILGAALCDGLVIVKEGHRQPECRRVQLLEAGHPIPDQRGVLAASQLSEFLTGSQADDLVICLISGGGSALMVSPVPGIELAEMQRLTSALLASGAAIQEINTLRKHLEQLKGGGLARRAFPANLITLILSDVIGDPLDVIASGPTVPDPSTYQQAKQILEHYDLMERAPAAVVNHLNDGLHGRVTETPKPGDPAFAKVQNVVIGSNRLAARAALEQAQREGFNPLLLTTSMQGEARQAGRVLASMARELTESSQPMPRPACLAAGGETTVTLTGGGLGGRNQELALGAVSDLSGLPDVLLVSLATDGGDGPTDAAGAVVTGRTLEQARRLGLDPAVHLKNNDSYHFFKGVGDLIQTGPTMTNVNDLTLVFSL